MRRFSTLDTAAARPDAKIKIDHTSYSTNQSRRYHQLNAATAGENQNLPPFLVTLGMSII